MVDSAWRRLGRPLALFAIAALVISRIIAEPDAEALPSFVETALALFSPIALFIEIDSVIRRVSVERRRMDAWSYALVMLAAGSATAAISGFTVMFSRFI